MPVSLNTTGKVVKGTGGQTGFIGVVCLTGRAVDVVGVATGTNFVGNKKAGDIVDVMTNGEITDITGTAGTSYTANTTTGVISTTAASATQIRIGNTVETTRLVVRARIA